MRLPNKQHFSLEEVATHLGCDLDTVLQYGAFNTLPLSVSLAEDLRLNLPDDEREDVSAGYCYCYCALSSLDVRELISNGSILRTVIQLMQASGKDDFFLGRISFAEGFTYQRVPKQMAPRSVVAASLVVVSTDLAEFVRSIELEASAELLGGGPTDSAVTDARRAATQDEIAAAFRQRTDPVANTIWWKDRLRGAKRSGLESSRVSKGKNSRIRSLWKPHCIAAWLTDKHAWSNKRAADALRKHFPNYSDEADMLDPPSSTDVGS